MRDELKYPKAFALQKMVKKACIKYNSFDEILGYIVSPCYLIEENLLYDKDGNQVDSKRLQIAGDTSFTKVIFLCLTTSSKKF